MKCINCGEEVNENAKFCTNCGKNITDITPTNSSTQQEPLATYINNGEPPKKQKNVALIVIFVIIGAMLVFGIIVTIIIKMFLTKVTKAAENIGENSTINDIISNDDTYGEAVKTVKDPTGHEIKIVSDKTYMYKVDTSYLYDKSTEMRKNAKKVTTKDIEMSMASTEQKEAMKYIIKKLDDIILPTKESIKEELKKEGYDDATIEYALANCKVDWQEQANIKVLTVLAAGGYSPKEIKDLMKYEGYPDEVIDNALNKEKYDFYEQATYDACFLRYTSPKYGSAYTRETAKKMLEYSEYSKEEIEFALKIIYDEMK